MIVDEHKPRDADLLAAFAGGDAAAFGELVQRHVGWVYAAAHRQLGDADLAEDATQAVFLLLCGRAKRLARHPRVSGWLFLATQFTVRAMMRSERRRRVHERRAMMERHETSDDGAMLAGALDAAVAKLPAKERAAVVLRFYEGLDFAMVAAEMGITEAAARKRVTRAIERLRARLGEGVSAASLGAAAMHGAPANVTAISAHASHAALAASGGGTVSTSVAAATKGAAILMATTQTKVTAGVILAAVLAAGVGAGAWSLWKPEPPVRAAAPVPASAEATSEPATSEPVFETVYAAPAGADDVVRITPPFVEGRLDFYNRMDPAEAASIPSGPDGMILAWEDGKLTEHGMTFGDGKGYSVSQLIEDLLDVYAPNVEGPPNLLKRRISGDFIVRIEPGHTFNPNWRRGLERMLSEALGQGVKMNFEEVERPAYVLTDVWTPHLTATRKGGPLQVEIYGKSMNKNMIVGGGGSGSMTEFANSLGQWIKTSVIIEATGTPRTISWHINDAFDVPDARDNAHDPDLVLQHITEQTGLSAKLETRKMQRLIVEWRK